MLPEISGLVAVGVAAPVLHACCGGRIPLTMAPLAVVVLVLVFLFGACFFGEDVPTSEEEIV